MQRKFQKRSQKKKIKEKIRFFLEKESIDLMLKSNTMIFCVKLIDLESR
jgi:hypothetical protein